MPAHCLAPLRDSADLIGRDGALAARLDEAGYLFLRGALGPELAGQARHAVLRRLADVDEVSEPDGGARATGRSRRLELEQDRGAFWQSVSE